MPSDKPCYTTEQKLIEACIRQDSKAQRLLYEKYAPRMMSVCRRYVTDKDSAKDLLQEGFITAFAKLGSYHGDGSFEGWLRKIFVNTALMSLRKNDVMRDAKDVLELRSQTPFVDNVVERLEGKDIFELITKMPTGFRTIFNMNVIDGYSHQEIAKALGITEGASRSQLSRARVWLQENILKLEKGTNER